MANRNWHPVTQRFIVGKLYIIGWTYKGYCVCEFVKVTDKGHNFKNIATGKYHFRTHLYPAKDNNQLFFISPRLDVRNYTGDMTTGIIEIRENEYVLIDSSPIEKGSVFVDIKRKLVSVCFKKEIATTKKVMCIVCESHGYYKEADCRKILYSTGGVYGVPTKSLSDIIKMADGEKITK